MATVQHASMISLALGSVLVMDVMTENRRHPNKAKKATTASENVRQPRKLLTCTFPLNLTNAMSHGTHREGEKED